MNFLAHYVTASRAPVSPLPAFIVGSALPDLLPRAAPRIRLRPAALADFPSQTLEENALRAGVFSHLTTDAAFHKSDAFALVQAEIGVVLDDANFDGMRIRRFFLTHILTELALDAALLRADPTLAEGFYAHFDAADFLAVTRWTERAADRSLPTLTSILSRFARSRYLFHYRTDAGLAEGVNRLCARARQETFDGKNAGKLERAAGKSVEIARFWQAGLLDMTAKST